MKKIKIINNLIFLMILIIMTMKKFLLMIYLMIKKVSGMKNSFYIKINAYIAYLNIKNLLVKMNIYIIQILNYS